MLVDSLIREATVKKLLYMSSVGGRFLLRTGHFSDDRHLS